MVTFSFIPHASRAACELKRKVIGGAFITVILCAASPAFAQEHAAAAEGGGMIAALIWPTVNFIILCGILYHFLRAPQLWQEDALLSQSRP